MKLVLFIFLGVSLTGAATLTVGPHGGYATPCAALHHASDGDTVLVDANNGIPYKEAAHSNHGVLRDINGGIPYVGPMAPNHAERISDCDIRRNHLTIRGIHGRPILDAAGEAIQRGIFVLYGHDIVIDNFEFRNAINRTDPDRVSSAPYHWQSRPSADLRRARTAGNAAAIRIEDGSNNAPDGGNITVRHCYIHDNGDGILVSNSGPRLGSWFASTPFLLFEYDDFYHNGDGTGFTHNIYIGADGYGKMHFTLRYSKSRDAYVGHTVKSRAPYNNILYNQITDSVGVTSFKLDFPLGGTTYVVGNLIYSTAMTNPLANNNLMIYRDVGDNSKDGPAYGPPNEDLHFINNVVIDNNPSTSNSFVAISCAKSSSEDCPAPNFGPRLIAHAEIKGNLFVGRPTHVTNQPDADAQFNVVLPYSDKSAVWINQALASLWNGEK